MSLWVDKYRPTTLAKLDYHQDQAELLKKMVKSGDFPHLLVYGPSGAGKKTRVMCILRELYGAGVERLRIEHKTFTGPSNKKLELTTVASNYHIEMNPSDVGFYDRIVVQEVIKGMAQTGQLEPGSQRDFKIVVLREVDKLTKDAQHALRRTMEKFMGTCRLVLCCQSTSRILAPLRSRCLGIRVPAPTSDQIVKVLETVCKKEGIQVNPDMATQIAEKSAGNLRRALLMAESCRVRKTLTIGEKLIPDPDWEAYLKETANLIIKEQSPRNLMKVRERLYELLGRCIPAELIFKYLLLHLLRSCDAEIKPRITAAAADCEHRLHLGSKHIYHLEAFIAKFMSIYKTYMENIMMDFD